MNNDDILSPTRIFSCIKREKKIIGMIVLAFLSAALLFCLISPAKYTATSSVLLDQALAASNADVSSKAERVFSQSDMLSQVEIIKSRRVAEKVKEILKSKGSLAADVVIASDDLQRNLRVFRQGDSYVLTIQYVAGKPQEAADFANAYAEAYIQDQLSLHSEDSDQTTQWLQDKIEEVRGQSVEISKKIQDFQTKNNIVQARGISMSEQQLQELNIRMAEVKSDVATAQVRYQHSQEIISKGDVSAATAEAFDNDVINNVRAHYLEDQQEYMKLKRKLEENHQSVQALERKLSESRNIIFGEMRRIAQSHKNDYEVALAKEKTLQNTLESVATKKLTDDEQGAELLALEKEAESYNKLYDDYLMKYEMLQKQSSFPVVEAKIISRADVPQSKSHPKTILILAMSLIFGLGTGLLSALAKDNFDISIKRGGQIENILKLHFLGFTPMRSSDLVADGAGSNMFSRKFSYAVDEPLSLHAEVCRHIKMKSDKPNHSSEKCHVIGCLSDNPNEDKSSIASNLALSLASGGKKTLLVDADMRNPILSRSTQASFRSGLIDVINGSASLDTVLLKDQKTGLFFLPNNNSRLETSWGIISTDVLATIIEQAKSGFDYVIIDLPPLTASHDAVSTSRFVNSYVLVLEWGKSKPNAVEFALKTNEVDKAKILGAVVSKADMDVMQKGYGHKVHDQYAKV